MSAMRAGRYALVRLGLAILAGVVVGLLLHRVFAGIAIALAVLLAWQWVQLYWLNRWLKDPRNEDAPAVRGLWGDVVARVGHIDKRRQYHKARVLKLFREFRRSTAVMPDGVIVLNKDGEIAWFNRTAARLLGLRGKADRGMRITNLVREPALRDYLASEEFAEPVLIRRGDEGPWLSFQLVPYSAAQRLMLLRDVSRQVALESMRQDFVANASHELRSPLTVMTGYLETLIGDPVMDEELRGPLLEMQRQTQRMNGIVSDLLDLSRLDAQVVEAPMTEIDIEAMCALLRKDVQARPVHPQVQVSIETPARLLGDQPEVLSAFSNLVDNAVKFTPEVGSIHLRWYLSPAGEACFAVSDTGPGIAPEHLPRLTERFYRADAGRARGAGGTGLGLAIVKHALLYHGGRLDIQSEPGAGSTFTCVFPARRVSVLDGGATLDSSQRSSSNGNR
ncbi:MAG: phosphate regulon sensor histidine kinase PhoR [Nevskiaceae bacterium]|jgi:two-component system phosphate regulon sensor histidine kinase PhoR|nr:phosphate regulon sensor histidine kinase PhoR [Nevskiaceae bacterium]